MGRYSATCTPCVPSHGGTPKRLTDCVWEGMPGVICVLVEGKKTGKAGLLWELRQLQINQRLSFVSLAMDKRVSICLGAPVNCHEDTDTRGSTSTKHSFQ